MTSNSEMNYESSRVMSRNKEATHMVKPHRIGKASPISSMATGGNRVLSSRQSPKHIDEDDSHYQKSRIGTTAAKCRKKSGKGGSIVKAPRSGIGGRKLCEVAPITDQERNAPRSVSSKGADKCHDVPYRHIPEKCKRAKVKWQNGVYCRDECGSGIVPKKFEFKHSRRVWCHTPLSMYQATIGELGRQILCREKIVPRDVKPSPPCNVAEYILPPCGGYYRKYDCIRPCEEEYVSYKQGRKLYRDRVERYWEPCQLKDQKVTVDINTFAHQNAFLGDKLRRKFNESLPCW